MIEGLAGVVLNLYTLARPDSATIKNQSSECERIEIRVANRMHFQHENNVLVANFENKSVKFVVDFYRKNSNGLDSPENLRQWIEKRNYDSFYVFETGNDRQRLQLPTASAYFEGDKLFVMYDFVTISPDGEITADIPDGYTEKAECLAIQGNETFPLIRGIFSKILNERAKAGKRP